MTFDPPTDIPHMAPVTGYKAELVVRGGAAGTGVKFEVDFHSSKIQLTNLVQGRNYDVYVRSRNAAGLSQPQPAAPAPFTAILPVRSGGQGSVCVCLPEAGRVLC